MGKSEQTVTAKKGMLLQSAMCNRGNFNECLHYNKRKFWKEL